MVMTAEQKKAKESAEKFMIYLYKKYYPQIEVEMKKYNQDLMNTKVAESGEKGHTIDVS